MQLFLHPKKAIEHKMKSNRYNKANKHSNSMKIFILKAKNFMKINSII